MALGSYRSTAVPTADTATAAVPGLHAPLFCPVPPERTELGPAPDRRFRGLAARTRPCVRRGARCTLGMQITLNANAALIPAPPRAGRAQARSGPRGRSIETSRASPSPPAHLPRLAPHCPGWVDRSYLCTGPPGVLSTAHPAWTPKHISHHIFGEKGRVAGTVFTQFSRLFSSRQ